jgi:protein-S-isoprenylcysteine O-methyltransferase Ste14
MASAEPFRTVLLGGTLVIFPLMLYHRLKSRTSERLDRRQEGTFILLTLRPIGLATIGGIAVYLSNPAAMRWASLPLPPWLRWCGAAIGLVGGILVVWTVRTLGPNLTDTVVTRRHHTLVLAGPYRWVRHPFYGSIALLLLAYALSAANWFVFAGGLAVFSLLVMRTAAEEERLVARFGDAYRTYMQQTGRFLPRVAPPRPDVHV